MVFHYGRQCYLTSLLSFQWSRRWSHWGVSMSRPCWSYSDKERGQDYPRLTKSELQRKRFAVLVFRIPELDSIGERVWKNNLINDVLITIFLRWTCQDVSVTECLGREGLLNDAFWMLAKDSSCLQHPTPSHGPWTTEFSEIWGITYGNISHDWDWTS